MARWHAYSIESDIICAAGRGRGLSLGYHKYARDIYRMPQCPVVQWPAAVQCPAVGLPLRAEHLGAAEPLAVALDPRRASTLASNHAQPRAQPGGETPVEKLVLPQHSWELCSPKKKKKRLELLRKLKP